MVIGYVENYIGPNIVVLWFYQQKRVVDPIFKTTEFQWVKIYTQTVSQEKRQKILYELQAKHTKLVILGRGT